MAKKKANKWLQGSAHKEGAIRHPGALKAAAKRHGRSTLEEAKVESRSGKKSVASRGRLGLRLMGAAKHGNIRHKKTRHKRVSAKG
jgi:hypothetical protein